MEQPNSGSPSETHIDDLVSKLPVREGMVLYKSYWLWPQTAKRVMLLQDMFKARDDDVILATNPKCGTTWLKALAFTITTRALQLRPPQPPSPHPSSPGGCAFPGDPCKRGPNLC